MKEENKRGDTNYGQLTRCRETEMKEVALDNYKHASTVGDEHIMH